MNLFQSFIPRIFYSDFLLISHLFYIKMVTTMHCRVSVNDRKKTFRFISQMGRTAAHNATVMQKNRLPDG